MDGQLAAIEAARSAEELLKAVKGVQRLLPSCARFSAEQAAAQAAAVDAGAAPTLARLMSRHGSGCAETRANAALALTQLYTFGPDAERLSLAVAETEAVEIAVANVLEGVPEARLAAMYADPELLRWRSIMVLNNLAVFAPQAHARLLAAGAARAATLILLSAEGLAAPGQEPIHPHLLGTTVSCLCCLAYHPPSRPAVREAGAVERLLRIATGPPTAYEAVAAIALANLAGSALTLPPRTVRKVLRVFEASLLGKMCVGIYFVPWMVAMSLGAMVDRPANAEQLLKHGAAYLLLDGVHLPITSRASAASRAAGKRAPAGFIDDAADKCPEHCVRALWGLVSLEESQAELREWEEEEREAARLMREFEQEEEEEGQDEGEHMHEHEQEEEQVEEHEHDHEHEFDHDQGQEEQQE